MATPTGDPSRPRHTDNALTGKILGGSPEPTYGGILSFMRRRYSRDLEGVDLVVWGIPFDAAVSNRPGARFGPQAIRRASAILDADPQYPFGFDPFETLAAVDYGDCSLDYGRHEGVPAQIEAQATSILEKGPFLLSLGGDHFVTLPLLRAHHARHGPMALVQFDAHQDTWDDDGSRIDHGTFVGVAVKEGLIDPARSIQIGIRTHAPDDFGIEIVDAETCHDIGVAGMLNSIRARTGEGPVYVTVDIDSLDPAFAPGTGTPVSCGLTSAQLLMTLRRLGFLDIVGMDVVEVAPAYDHAEITAIAGAAVAMYGVGLVAERRR